METRIAAVVVIVAVLRLAEFALQAAWKRTRRRLMSRLLDPTRMSAEEKDPYFNREYARRVTNATAVTSPSLH